MTDNPLNGGGVNTTYLRLKLNDIPEHADLSIWRSSMVHWLTRVARVAWLTARWKGRLAGTDATRELKALEVRLARQIMFRAVNDIELYGGDHLTYRRRTIEEWEGTMATDIEKQAAAQILWHEWLEEGARDEIRQAAAKVLRSGERFKRYSRERREHKKLHCLLMRTADVTLGEI